MDHGAIILCGGASARMGRDKAWLPFGPGETMLDRVMRLVSEAVPAEKIVCVAAPDQPLPRLPERVRVVRDREPHVGPLAGLTSGLAVLESDADAVYVTGCDVPLLVPAVVSRLFDLLGEDEIAVPHDGERYHPLAGVYRTGVLSAAEMLLAAGERSLVSLIDRCRSRTVALDALREIDPNLGSLTNCNTPEDYRRALVAGGFPA
jgi:molybdopterin-guanine dinucleotide biosynthesis protein A